MPCAALGRREEARERFSDALALRNRYGLLAEDIHPADRRAVGQFPPDLFHGRGDPERHAAQPKLGGPLLARIFIISNRVAMPQSGNHPGGLEVVLKATLEEPSLRLAGLERARSSATPRTQHHHARATTTISSPTSSPRISTNITTASPTGCCGRSCITGWTWRNSPAATCRAICGSMTISPIELAKVLEPDDIVWVHDYHLIPLAKALRARGLTNRIGFFLHIPLPPPEILTAMPNHETLIPSLGDYDLVGFQTDGDAANFARYLASELGTPSHISLRLGTGDRAMRIGTFPVGIETARLHPPGAAGGASTEIRAAGAADRIPGALMIGVDRLDYSKGIPLRLEAYERFLAANPRMARQDHLSADHAQEPQRHQGICRDGAGGEQHRRAASTAPIATPPGRRCAMSTAPIAATALAGLYRAARVGAGDAAARRHESGGQGICRRPGRRQIPAC